MKKINLLIEKFKNIINYLVEKFKNIKNKKVAQILINKKFLLISVLIILMIIILGVWNHRSSKEYILNNLQIALKENKPEKIYKEIKFKDEKITRNQLKPLTEYYSERESKVSEIIKGIGNSGEDEYFRLVNEKIFIFNNYYIEVMPVSVEINTNFHDTKVYINDEEIIDSNLKIDLIPGKYLLKGKLKTLYGTIEEEKEIYAIENSNFNLDMRAINITLTSNFDDADVFINDEDINKKVSEMKNYGPIPLDKKTWVKLEREFPWGKIESENIEISNLPNINLDIDIVNDKLIEDVKKITNIFYKSVFDALNNSDSSLILNSKDGTKSKIYDSIKKESLFLKNNYELNDLQTELKRSEFYYKDSKYKGNLVINLSYNIKKKILPFINRNVEEMFLTNIEYENGSWIINDVQKISLD